MMFDQNKKR